MKDENLIKNHFAEWEDKADPDVPTATFQIYQFISEYLGERKSNEINRASSATLCPKRRWYQKNGYNGTPLTPRKSINFLLGDLSERVMLYFISRACVGEGKLYSEVCFGKELGSIHFQGKELKLYDQEEWSGEIANFKFTSHPDGRGKRNSDGKWELIECKSAANYGFKGFKDGEDNDYLKQSHANMLTKEATGLGIRDVRFFYLRKETGHLWDRLYSFNEGLVEEMEADFVAANGSAMPKAPYQLTQETEGRKEKVPTGFWVAPWQCQYCPFLKTCHGDYQLDWKADQWGNMKPIYRFQKRSAA